MLLVTLCPGCGAAGPVPCEACWAQMRPSSRVPPPPGLDLCRALLDFDGPARDLVSHIKYRNSRGALRWLAAGMADLVRGEPIDVVTWAPTTDLRRRSRGFDHAELLARRVARNLRMPCRALLSRLPGPPQTGRSLLDRRDGPEFVPKRRLDGASVLVVDDVVTTGATLASAAMTLRMAGASQVGAVAAAHPR